MRNAIILFLVFCLLQQAGFGQTGNMQKPVGNTYESGLKNVIKEVQAVMEGKAQQVKLTGTATPKPSYGSLDYSTPALVFPGALTTALRQNRFNWEGGKGISDWTWTTTLLQFIKGTQTERLKSEMQMLEKLMTRLYPAAVKKQEASEGSERISFTINNLTVTVFAAYDYQYSTLSTLELSMNFKLTTSETKQQIADPLRIKLDTELAISYSPKDKAKIIKEWAQTLQAYAFDKQEIVSYGTALLQQIANTDMNTAFEMIMEWPQGRDEVNIMVEPLSYSQKNIIREKANKIVADYNSQYTKKEEPAAGPDWSVFKGFIKPENIKPENRSFYEVTAKDLASVVKETFIKNGESFYRFAQDYKISQNEYYYFSMSELKRNFMIVFYSEHGIAGKSYITVAYEGAATDNNKRITGGDCTIDTDCSRNNICKTSCTGTIKVDRIGNNGFNYTFKLQPNAGLAGIKYFWTVLFDYKN